MIDTSRLDGSNGCYHITSADGAKTGMNFFAIVTDASTTITVLSGVNANGATVNFLTALNLSGKTLSAGNYISVPKGSTITAITVTGGAAIGYYN